MKDKDLINQLSKFNPNMDILFTSTVEDGRSVSGLGLEETCVLELCEEGEEFTVMGDCSDPETIQLDKDVVLLKVDGEVVWSE